MGVTIQGDPRESEDQIKPHVLPTELIFLVELYFMYSQPIPVISGLDASHAPFFAQLSSLLPLQTTPQTSSRNAVGNLHRTCASRRWCTRARMQGVPVPGSRRRPQPTQGGKPRRQDQPKLQPSSTTCTVGWSLGLTWPV